MTTHREIVRGLRSAADSGCSVVLATVVRITGSNYAGVGARMICLADGSRVGLVSGGCLESDLAGHAERIYEKGQPEVVTYDNSDDYRAPWGLGLGCNGMIEVLLEPLSPTDARAVADLIDYALKSESPSVIATVIRSLDSGNGVPRVGSHALIDGFVNGSTGDWGGGSELLALSQYAGEALAAGRRGIVREIGSAEIAFEAVMPMVRLIVCGAGPDAIPVVRLASELGWDVSVVDHRPRTEERAARFPGASFIHCEDPRELARLLTQQHKCAAVVMSHNFDRDRDYLRALLEWDVTYVGVMGARARTQRMLAELNPGDDALPELDERFFSPIGLDIGAEGPDAIALSIISQVAAVTSGRTGGHLRDRRGPLHTSMPPAVATATV